MSRLLLLVICVLFTRLSAAEVLTLSKALDAAKSHPAIENKINASSYNHLNYMSCHDLVFNNNIKTNSQDNLPVYSMMPPLVAQKIEIMRRFFDVILSDISFATNNAHMATAFIKVDRVRVRSELGQYSEKDVAALESIYQSVRLARFASEKNQRFTRSKLAEAMGDIDKLWQDLQQPELKFNKLVIPDFDELSKNALEKNTALDVTEDKAKRKVQAMRLKQQILNLVLRLEMLVFAKDNADALSYYRDIYLDHSRALYEMEVKSDLGDSMVWQSRALLQETIVNFCIALTYAEINALQGKAVWPINYER